MIGKVNTVGFDYERVSNNMYPFNPFNRPPTRFGAGLRPEGEAW